MLKWLGLSAIVVVLDQATKWWIVQEFIWVSAWTGFRS